MEVRESRRAPVSTDVRVKEVHDAIKRMNSGMSYGMDGIKVELLKAEEKKFYFKVQNPKTMFKTKTSNPTVVFFRRDSTTKKHIYYRLEKALAVCA